MKCLEDELMAEVPTVSLEEELMVSLSSSNKKKKKKGEGGNRLDKLEKELLCTADIAEVHVDRPDTYDPAVDIKCLEMTAVVAFFPIEKSEFSREILKEKHKVIRGWFPKLKKSQADAAITKAKEQSPYIYDTVNVLLATVESWPRYTRDAFATKKDYDKWVAVETARLQKLKESVELEPPYSGRLEIKILRLKSLVTPKEKFKSAYIEVQLGSGPPLQTVTNSDLDSITLQINFDEDFVLQAESPSDKLTITLYENGKSTGTFVVPVSQLSDSVPHFTWYRLLSKKDLKKIASPKPKRQGKDVGASSSSNASDLFVDDKKKKADVEVPEVYVYTHYVFRYAKSPEGSASSGLSKKREDFHEMFNHLLQRIVEATDGLMVQFDPTITWVMTEFCRRYAVGEAYREIRYFSLLANAWSQKRSHLALLESSLRRCTRLTAKNSRTVLTQSERDNFEQTLETLKFRVTNLLSKYTFAFPVDPDIWETGALNALINILPEVVSDSDQLNDILTNCIEKTITFSYELFKQNEQQDMAKTDAGDCAVLAASVDQIIKSLENTIKFYKREFPEGVDILTITAISYYNLLFQDMRDLWARNMEISIDLFELYFKLERLHVILYHIVKGGLKVMPLKDMFGPYVTTWIREAQKKMMEWTQKAFQRDVDLNFPPIAKDKGVIHCGSTVDTFESFNQAMQFVGRIKMFDLTPQKIAFSGIVGEVVDWYLQAMFDNVVTRIDQMWSNADVTPEQLVARINTHYEAIEKRKAEIEHENEERARAGIQPSGNSSSLESLTMTPAMCVMVNSFHSMSEQYDHFIEDLTDITERSKEDEESTVPQELQDVFANEKKVLAKYYHQLVCLVTSNISRWLEACLLHLLGPPPLNLDVAADVEARLAPTINLLNMELGLLSDNLYPDVFSDILHEAWISWLTSACRMLCPPGVTDDAAKRETQSKVIGRVLPELIDFFFADGAGIPRDQMKSESQLLTSIIDTYKCPTPKVLQMFQNLLDGKSAKSPAILIAIDSDSDSDSDSGDCDKKKSEDDDDDEVTETSIQKELDQHHLLCILATRSDPQAKKLVSSRISSISDLPLRRKFNIPVEEEFLHRGSARGPGRESHRGTLFLTSAHLLFDPFLPGMSRYAVKFSIKFIQTLEKVPDDSKLVITTVSKKTYSFSKLTGLEDWYGRISKQGSIVSAPFVEAYSNDAKLQKAVELLKDSERKNSEIFSSKGKQQKFEKHPTFLPDDDEIESFIRDQENYLKQFPEGEMDPLIQRFSATYKKKAGDFYISIHHVSFASSAIFGKQFRVPLSSLKGADMRQGTLAKSILALQISAREEYLFEFKSDVDKAHRLISDLIERKKM